MSLFAEFDEDSDSSMELDEDLTPKNSPKPKPINHPFLKDMKLYYWKSPADNNLFPTEKERENSKNPPPLVLPAPGVSWADFDENLEKTPGTEEYEKVQERLKRSKYEEEQEKIKRIERMKHMEFQKKRRLEERKRIESLSINLGGELYSSIHSVVKQRDEIGKRNKVPFEESNQPYIILPPKDQDFLWDLIEYHPKAAEKKQVIQTFVFGSIKARNFSGLLVLQNDGTLDSFSQQKPFKRIEEIFIRRGLGEPNIMKKKKSFQKRNNKFNYNYNNNKIKNKFY